MKGPISSDNDSVLPSTVLSQDEMQNGSLSVPTYRSTFNIELPIALHDPQDPSARYIPYEWMKNQYSHCVVPELGEEYGFEFGSQTFHALRYLHNARVRIRNEEFLPADIVCSLADRWVSLEEKNRPASEGYLANGDIFITTTCVPLSHNEDGLKQYFERNYSVEPSAQHYIPLSKYSVHFVGEPQLEGRNKIESVLVGSVLIRNTRTGDVVHIDTGTFNSREDRARTAGKVLKAWLQFQKTKTPDADLGPISSSEPLILDVDKETHPSLRSIHALVSASLFLRRGIKNWGDVRAFQKTKGTPNSRTMANHALQNISGWLGIKSTAKHGQTRSKKPSKSVNTFEDNYEKDILFGRLTPAPASQRITSAQKCEPPVYNEETSLADNASDDEDDHSGSSVGSSHDSVDDTTADDVDNNESIVVADQPKTSNEVANNEKNAVSWSDPIDNSHDPLHEPNHEKSSDGDSNDEDSKNGDSHESDPNDKGPNGEEPDNNDGTSGRFTSIN